MFESAAWGADPPIDAGPYRLVSTNLAITPQHVGGVLGDLRGLGDFASEYPPAGRDFSVGHAGGVYLGMTLERFPGVFSSVIEQIVNLNNRLPLLDSPAERRELPCAIDRASLVEQFLPEADRATPGITTWVPAHEGFVPDIEPLGPSNPACPD